VRDYALFCHCYGIVLSLLWHCFVIVLSLFFALLMLEHVCFLSVLKMCQLAQTTTYSCGAFSPASFVCGMPITEGVNKSSTNGAMYKEKVFNSAVILKKLV